MAAAKGTERVLSVFACYLEKHCAIVRSV